MAKNFTQSAQNPRTLQEEKVFAIGRAYDEVEAVLRCYDISNVNIEPINGGMKILLDQETRARLGIERLGQLAEDIRTVDYERYHRVKSSTNHEPNSLLLYREK